MKQPKAILLIIVIAQFLCTSLWFAGNGVMQDLTSNFGFPENALGYLTSAVQFGFIIGTLISAILSIADRYAPSKVFFVCAILGAIFNFGITWQGNTLISMLLFRFLTGFFLAGIYPVGMKIAADYFEKGLGKSLGFLIGALVLGTAFPHLLKEIKGLLPWEVVLISTSFLAILGGVLMLLLVPNGPFCKPSQQVNFSAIRKIFQKPNFRSAAFGYFGHMWELYAFWTFVPIILQIYSETHSLETFNISLLSFVIIGAGSFSCIIAGYFAQAIGVKKVAFIALLLSCICCIISPFMFSINIPLIFFSFLIFWGMVVIADSPMFSTLVAQNAPSELKGTALTIVNSIGFFTTIISIQLINQLKTLTDSSSIFIVLAIGPIFGLLAILKKNAKA